MSFITKSFDQLSLQELYEILSLRQEVFIVEQDCPYLDADFKDQKSFHVFSHNKDGLIHTYTRLVPPGVSYLDHSSIGRVITSLSLRNTGVGKKLMKYSIDQCFKLFPEHDIKISAQEYLDKFYSNLGFVKTGVHYLEDDIPHQAMILKRFK